jgi:UDP-N-acetylmuramate dehydrogenase
VADEGFDGIAVVLGPFAQEIDIDGTTVVAGGAVSLPVLARRTVAAGLTGLEWAVGVPGSVGGACA